MSDDPIQVPIGLTTEGLLGRRYLARAIDSTIIAILAVAALNLLGAGGAQTDRGFSSILWSLLALLILWISYGALLESSPWQATLGKRVMGLRVYDFEGGRLKVFRAAGRNLLKDGPFFLLALIPGGRLLSVVWLGAHLVVLHRSPVYQAIHDRVARTWVAAPEATIQLHLALLKDQPYHPKIVGKTGDSHRISEPGEASKNRGKITEVGLPHASAFLGADRATARSHLL